MPTQSSVITNTRFNLLGQMAVIAFETGRTDINDNTVKGGATPH